LKDLWDRLEAFARKNTPRSLRLRPGASEKAIAAAEKKLKLTFPPAFRESLLAHDGQERSDDDDEITLFPWLPGCSPLAPLADIVAQWKDERDNEEDEDEDEEPEAEGAIFDVLTHPRRVPIAGTAHWDGDNTYVDLFPTAKGTVGQVVMFTSECDIALLGSSLRDALETYLHALESGDWVFDPMTGVRPKGKKSNDNTAEAFAAYAKKLAKSRKVSTNAAPKKTGSGKAAPKTSKPAKKRAP
jgi:cell wall assembly regulator SMI1